MFWTRVIKTLFFLKYNQILTPIKGNYIFIFIFILLKMLLLLFYRIVSEIEENLMTNNFNSSSEFITKDNLTEDYITIKTHMIDDDEFKESKFQSVDVSTSVRNATINEDIPSFREWTKKQLEEAEKQPGMK